MNLLRILAFFFLYIPFLIAVPVAGGVNYQSSLTLQTHFNQGYLGILSNSRLYEKILTIIFSCNTSGPHAIRIDSKNNGRLVRKVFTGSSWGEDAKHDGLYEVGNSMIYYIDFEMGSGTLGFQDSNFSSYFPIDSSFLYSQFNYPTASLKDPSFLVIPFEEDAGNYFMREATVDQEIHCRIMVLSDQSSVNLRGLYSDTLTISLLD